MSEVKLKPCPFCGSSNLRFENLVLEALIACRDCKARIIRRHDSNTDNATKEVIEAWNTRPAASVVSVQEIKNILKRVGEWDEGCLCFELSDLDNIAQSIHAIITRKLKGQDNEDKTNN